jgi:serine/threonine-protein kinase
VRGSLANSEPPTNPSTIVADIDPAIERVILRCLERDPARRPSSAIAVASALPGGDPLAAALAAGETPSPEMVAAAAETDRLSMRAIGICTAAIAVGLAAAAVLGARTNPLEQTPFDQPPAALEQKARELVRSFGYEEPPIDRVYGLLYDDSRRWMNDNMPPAVFEAQLRAGQPAGIRFWYRQSPRYLEPLNDVGEVTTSNPPMATSGMVRVYLDPQGRLVQFDAVPEQVEKDPPASSPVENWTPLLTAAGIDLGRFGPAAPSWLPLSPFDARAAWTGSFAHAPDVPIRVEAAAWRGRPIYFQVIGPWSRPTRESGGMPAGEQRANVFAWIATAIVITVAGSFAWRHVRQGRADVRGASRVSVFLFGCSLVIWACTTNHAPTAAELSRFSWALSEAAFYGATVWVLYVALEPHVRRRWPESIISWSRLLGGGIAHPLVGGHLLLGTAFGLAYTILFQVRSFLDGGGYSQLRLASVVNTPQMVSTFIFPMLTATMLAMGLVFLFLLLRVLLRRPWLAAIVFGLIVVIPATLAAPSPNLVGAAVAASLQFGLLILILSRYGVLPMVVGILVSSVLPAFPLTTNLGTWYTGSTLFAIGAVIALTAYALYTAIDKRAIVAEGFLERA